MSESAVLTQSKQYTTFLLGGLYLGVEVLKVQELIRHQEMTRVPLAPSVVRGLINLRGQIVTAVDVRRRLGMPDLESDTPPMNVVVLTSDGAASLLVDEICDVVEVHEDQFEPPPDTLREGVADFVTGVYKLPDRLLLVLDVDRALDLN